MNVSVAELKLLFFMCTLYTTNKRNWCRWKFCGCATLPSSSGVSCVVCSLSLALFRCSCIDGGASGTVTDAAERDVLLVTHDLTNYDLQAASCPLRSQRFMLMCYVYLSFQFFLFSQGPQDRRVSEAGLKTRIRLWSASIPQLTFTHLKYIEESK